MGEFRAEKADRVVTTNTQIRDLVLSHNRKVIGEAILTLLVGIVSCLIVYGVTFWLVWLAVFFFAGSYRQHAVLIAAAIVGVFALISIWYASRGFDPISNVDIDLTVKRNYGAELAMGLALGIPILRRESLAGVASLLIGGPVNLMDAWSLWRSRMNADAETIAAAQQVLVSAQHGMTADQITNPQAVSILHRLGLIKAISHGAGPIELQPTAKGLELLTGSNLSKSAH